RLRRPHRPTVSGTTSNPLVTSNTTVQGTYKFTVFVADGFGCSGTSDTVSILIANCYVSLAEGEPDENFGLYPIPATEFITLELANAKPGEPVDLTIYNAAGQPVFASRVNGPTTSIDARHLSPGLYILQFTNAGRLYSKKFIRQ
ncbi:MAG: T9SS type A sorting domain-containing protein, partial [Bacteroidota bacterium]